MTELRECGVCWYVYDPSVGDDVWQVAPGTAFGALPEHWRCPNCDASPEKFLVLRVEPTPRAMAVVRAYEQIVPRMRELPVFNAALAVEAVGFASFEAGELGIVITPWFMNLAYLPDEDAACLGIGEKRTCQLPAGEIELMGASVDGAPGFEICSLFSPMQGFADQASARATAEESLRLLFSPPEPDSAAPRARPSRRELFSRFVPR